MNLKPYLFSLLLPACGLSAQTQRGLTVLEKNGDVHAFAVSDVQKYTFAGKQFIVHLKSGARETLSISSIISMKTGKITPTGIDEVQAENHTLALCYDTGSECITLQTDGGEPCNAVLHSATGQAVRQWQGMTDHTPVSLKGLPQGMYILRTEDGRQAKFIKQ